ncbi:MAG TPA: site-2 protease family protein [Pyrinomonadaceae bacterium]|nr:site-2 protease family protein [Pyrinomonadaceae bacterium]
MSQANETITPISELSEPTTHHIPRPTVRQWALHAALFVVTAITITISGIAWLGGQDVDAAGGSPPGTGGFAGSLLLIPWYYISGVWSLVWQALTHPAMLVSGVEFSASLLAILACHEAGHYVFCRYYGVDATLPFFIPQPPLLIPGTFGAFIRMKSPVPSRRALFDIGLAGPLAGFIVIIPIAFVGVLTLHHVQLIAGEVGGGGGGITFNDPLLFRLIARAFRVDLDNSTANSFYLAAWFGALVTALNLMPVGQLDGGHGTFAVFGKLAHHWIGRVAFVTMAVISVLGWLWHGSPSGFVYVVLLAVMLNVRHPQPEQMEPLGTMRVAVGIVTLIVFALCFLPFPITIG